MAIAIFILIIIVFIIVIIIIIFIVMFRPIQQLQPKLQLHTQMVSVVIARSKNNLIAFQESNEDNLIIEQQRTRDNLSSRIPHAHSENFLIRKHTAIQSDSLNEIARDYFLPQDTFQNTIFHDWHVWNCGKLRILGVGVGAGKRHGFFKLLSASMNTIWKSSLACKDLLGAARNWRSCIVCLASVNIC